MNEIDKLSKHQGETACYNLVRGDALIKYLNLINRDVLEMYGKLNQIRKELWSMSCEIDNGINVLKSKIDKEKI